MHLRNDYKGVQMLRWFQALMPREDRFFDLFARHSQTLAAGAEALRGVLQGGESIARYCQLVSEREQEADEITCRSETMPDLWTLT
jgi:uncharacterized protein